MELTERLNKEINIFYKDAFRIAISNLSHVNQVIKINRMQKKASDKRIQWENEGIHVPPYLILSVTGNCNLSCAGCYAKAQERKSTELKSEVLKKLLDEAVELGVSTVITAGGEPFMRDDLLDVIGEYPNILFPVFTNGVLLNELKVKQIKRLHNVIPIISLEGERKCTDSRRGQGVYQSIQKSFKELKKNNVLFGASLTMSSMNCHEITDQEFVKTIVNAGCKVIFYIDYVPFEEGTENMELSDEMRGKIPNIIEGLRKRFPVLFVAFPGDESLFGGCLSAGRGFVHIGPQGQIEPCPFAPYGSDNIQDKTLKEALQSNFLTTIRNSHEKLEEIHSGCALFKNREWVQLLLEQENKKIRQPERE